MKQIKSILGLVLAGVLMTMMAVPAFAQSDAFGMVSGSLSYRQRIALLDADVVIELVDVTQPDALKVIASQRIITNGRQVPIRFGLLYEKASINPDGTYVVRASIDYADGPAWTSDADAPVITNDVHDVTLNMVQSRAEDSAEAGTVTGTVAYLQRIALPEDAVILVELLDISRADAPAFVLASQQLIANGRQVPIPFTLHYDTDSIAENATISISARILMDGELTWISDTVAPVITNGTLNADVLLVPVS